MSFEQGDKVKAEAGVDVFSWGAKGEITGKYIVQIDLRGVIQEKIGPESLVSPSGMDFVLVDAEAEWSPNQILLFNTADLTAETQQHGITDNATFEETYGDIIYIDWDEEGEISGGRGESPAADDITVKSEEIAIHVRLEGVPPALDTVVTLNVPGLSGTDYKVINRSYHEKVGEYCYGDIYLMHVT